MANFNIPYNVGVQAAKDVQVQYQNNRAHAMKSVASEEMTDQKQNKNVAWPEPKGNPKQLVGTIAGIGGVIVLGLVLHLLGVI
ncbi:MAG: hypothetical protein IJ206_00125 [Oscillospiraceae bacterium]|nr:hypothetical protein [Oscillospiraceae bacterium]